jgi:hypothetical protein
MSCDLESLGITDPVLMINSTESRDPARAGDNVTFYCLSGELIGLSRTTCQGSGNWEPDPSDITCTQVPISRK